MIWFDIRCAETRTIFYSNCSLLSTARAYGWLDTWSSFMKEEEKCEHNSQSQWTPKYWKTGWNNSREGKEKTSKKNRIIANNIYKNIRTLILCFGSINNPCPNFIFIVTKREVIKNGYFTVKLIARVVPPAPPFIASFSWISLMGAKNLIFWP